MNISEKILGKPLRDLTYQDIVAFFQTPREENDLLEFKSFNPNGDLQPKLKQIYKSVCAFSNSAGGLLIWGAPEGVKHPGKSEKTFRGALTPIDPSLEKDNVVSRISSNLVPFANSFNVQLLEDSSGNKICIVEIETSNYAPHQFENIYHMRIDGQSVPAPHHYIEALFKRISYPNIEGYLKFGQITSAEIPQNNVTNRTIYRMNVTVMIWNFSSLQNEENLYFTLHSDVALVEDYRIKSVQQKIYPPNGKGISIPDAISVLSLGMPYVFSETFNIDPHKANEKRNIITFTLLFGGKKSPSKISKYKIDTTRFPQNPDTNRLITEKIENQLNYEVMEVSGITKEAQLKDALGR